jgi:hypothetical protein
MTARRIDRFMSMAVFVSTCEVRMFVETSWLVYVVCCCVHELFSLLFEFVREVRRMSDEH